MHPLWAIEGGRVTVLGEHFAIDPRPPAATIGGVAAHLAVASPRALGLTMPAGLEGGRTPIRVEGVEGETAFIEVGVPLATGLHQVDNPV
ncbi:MAG: hypothetical protein ABIX28_06540, partial [Vicinamibacterales bacterium]